MQMQHFFAQLDTTKIHGLPTPAANNHTVTTVLGVVFAVTAAIALLMIVIAGFRFVIASGDSEDMARARMTIIYAVVGLLVSMAAFSIVTFVIKGVG